MTEYGPWKPTPLWAQLLGFKPWRRSRYASWMIGGGWDGFEYSMTADLGAEVTATNRKAET